MVEDQELLQLTQQLQGEPPAKLIERVLDLREKVVEATRRQAQSRDSIVSLRERLRAAREDRHRIREELTQAQRRIEDQQHRMIGMLAMAQAISVALVQDELTAAGDAVDVD